jgi:hypothetical protein
MDEPVSYGHRFGRKQGNNRCGDEERPRHAHRLTAGERQKRKESHQRDGEEQDDRAIDKNLGEQNGKGAGDHHDSDKGEALLDTYGPAPGQQLNGSW